MPEYTMITTTDTDIHVVEGNVAEVRMKASKVKWLTTIDNRFVNTAQVVSLWTPEPEQLEAWMGE